MENSYAEMNHLVSGELFSEKMDALTEAMGGGGGGGNSGVAMLTITYDSQNDVYLIDATYETISTYLDSGAWVYAKLEVGLDIFAILFPLAYGYDNEQQKYLVMFGGQGTGILFTSDTRTDNMTGLSQ